MVFVPLATSATVKTYEQVSTSAFYWFSLALKAHILPYIEGKLEEKQLFLHEGICFFMQVYEHEHGGKFRTNETLYQHASSSHWNEMVRHMRQWEGMLNDIWHEKKETMGSVRNELLLHHKNRWTNACYETTDNQHAMILDYVTQESLDVFQLCMERECEWESEWFYQISPIFFHIKERLKNQFSFDVKQWNEQEGSTIWRNAKDLSSFR